jgi:hypothetical protein
MPSPSSDLDAAVAEFEKARDALSAAQEAVAKAKTASSTRALTLAQAAYMTAGQAVRRLKDPERAHEVLEFNRYIDEKARLRRARAAKPVMSRD